MSCLGESKLALVPPERGKEDEDVEAEALEATEAIEVAEADDKVVAVEPEVVAEHEEEIVELGLERVGVG